MPTFAEGSEAAGFESDKAKAKWIQTDEDAMALISQLVDTTLLKHIADCETVKAMWDILEHMFKESGNSYTMLLILQLEEIKQANYPDLLTYTNEFSALIEKLKKQNIKRIELEKTMKFMAGLDDSFDNWKQIKIIYLRQKNAVIPTLQNLINEILNKERSRKQTSTTLAVYNKKKPGYLGNCKTCGLQGHKPEKCWKTHPELMPPWYKNAPKEKAKKNQNMDKNKEDKQDSKEEKQDSKEKKDKNRSNINLTTYALASDGQSPKDLLRLHGTTWYLDSAATEHMCVHRHWFEDDYTEGSVVFDGAGGDLRAIGYGTVKIPLLQRDGSAITATIRNVKHVVATPTSFLPFICPPLVWLPATYPVSYFESKMPISGDLVVGQTFKDVKAAKNTIYVHVIIRGKSFAPPKNKKEIFVV